MANMNKKLEEMFDLPELEELPLEQQEECEDIITNAAELYDAISNSEKLDSALSTVVQLNDHDKEMDTIAKEAMDSYTHLMTLGMNVSDAHAGRIFEVASLMLETSLKAKDAKVNRKMKTLELQLKKARLDLDTKIADRKTLPLTPDDDEDRQTKMFDRNELLRIINGKGDE